MKKILTLSLFLSICLMYGATDKYRLILNDDPATKITIAWNQISGSNPVVYYGNQDFGTNYSSYPNQKNVDRTTSLKGMSSQFARISNLQPNTAYYFVIKDDEGVSERFWFKTAPADRSKLSFIAGGDSRNNRTPRQNANKLVSKLKPNAVLFGGDMTSGDTAEQWKNWFDDWQLTTAPDGRMFPIIATRGNHEFNPTTVYQLFDTPNSDSYYAITFGNEFFRIYTLNTLISSLGSQKSWLENDLAENRNVLWKSAQYHFPIRPHQSRKLEGPIRYSAWANTFYKEGLKLVIECDSHVVKTTYPLKPTGSFNDNNDGFVIDIDKGTVYAGEGCWGAPTRANDDDKSWTRASGSFNQFKWFFVDEEKIEMRTIKVDNANQVESVTNENPFTLPQNLDVWQMPDGENTVYIYQSIEADFFNNMQYNYPTTAIDMGVNILSGEANVTNIKFYATNTNNLSQEVYLGEVNSAPYQLSSSVNEAGQYKIRAKIETINGSFSITRIINAGNFNSTTNSLVLSGSNDISEQDDGDIVLNENQLYIGYRIQGGYESTGLRFENVSIPKNAVITNAYIEFTPAENKTQTAEATITVEDSPNSLPFKENTYNLRDKMKATEELVWNIPSWQKDVTSNDTHTPNLTKLLKYITQLPNWQQGNAITFSFEPTGESKSNLLNSRIAYSYENNPAKAPKLVYEFTYKAKDWSATASVSPGVGIDKAKPNTPLDINGIMRSSVRNENNELYQCNENLEGAMGYDKLDKTIKVCTEDKETYTWKAIHF